MSSIITAFESLERKDVHFDPFQSSYVFYTRYPTAMSKKKYAHFLERLTKDYKLDIVDEGTKTSKFNRILNSNGRSALVIDAGEAENNKVKISRFEIQRNYENVKGLADYLLKIMTEPKTRA